MAELELNLFGIACPMNFVKTKIKLDSMKSGESLVVFLDEGEAIESVSKSVLEEGHKILSKEAFEGAWKLKILKT